MKAINIKWDIDEEDVLDTLENLTATNAADALNISEKVYSNMNTQERKDYALSVFDKCPEEITENLLGLPDETEIPDNIADDEDAISDWLSDTYGFCHDGFKLSEQETSYGKINDK